MHIFLSLFAASCLVFFGYFAIWSSSQPTTPKGISSFGRILAIILFVLAGLALVSPIAARHFHCACGMNQMQFRGHPGFMGRPQGPWMNRMQMPMPGDKNRPETVPEEKSETPPAK
jgi:hypothetical protein